MATTKGTDYGAEHQHQRRRYAQRMANGEQFLCPRCQELPLIGHDDDWDLGHTDDRTARWGPEHRSCNRAAGARNSHRATRSTSRAL